MQITLNGTPVLSKTERLLKEFGGNYTTFKVTFSLQRHVGYYVIQVYLPCIFLVMLSWIVFWTNPENGGDRLTVGITCILTIVFLLGYVNAMLPKDTSSESSLNNMDLTVRRNSEIVRITSSDSCVGVKRKEKVQVLPLTKKNMTEDVKPEVEPRSPDKNICFENPREKATSTFTSGSGRSQAVKIDFACRILFPLAFALYNTLYWYIYLNGIDVLA
ncbi:gamma-aminobutyric acid receptor subunit gamma-2-like [Montipora foliosa]|uniref:gamma-aminobutyric acid receptor subunit gamma-2-like n=1 Tax=Montipora foliosa TaxID=591990 RepID=UPI0035F13664